MELKNTTSELLLNTLSFASAIHRPCCKIPIYRLKEIKWAAGMISAHKAYLAVEVACIDGICCCHVPMYTILHVVQVRCWAAICGVYRSFYFFIFLSIFLFSFFCDVDAFFYVNNLFAITKHLFILWIKLFRNVDLFVRDIHILLFIHF